MSKYKYAIAKLKLLIMKKYNLLYLIFVCFIFIAVSCSNEGNETTTTKSDTIATKDTTIHTDTTHFSEPH